MSKIFIDTNILVYAFDRNSPKKQKKAKGLLGNIQSNKSIVISTQVIQEFYVVCTKRMNLPPAVAKQAIVSLSGIETVLLDYEIILNAVDCSAMDQLSFWDALIVSSASQAHCDIIWTEDLNHGQIIRGVKIENPLI